MQTEPAEETSKPNGSITVDFTGVPRDGYAACFEHWRKAGFKSPVEGWAYLKREGMRRSGGDYDEVWWDFRMKCSWSGEYLQATESGLLTRTSEFVIQDPNDQWRIESGKETIAGADDKVRWAIEGLLEEKSGLLLSGLPHTTKSLHLLCAALECVTTRKVWGKFHVPETIRNVVFLETEDSRALIKRRLRGFCKGLGIPHPPDGFHLVRTGPFDLLNKGEDKLREIIEATRADLLVLSTLQGLLNGADWKEQKDMAPINAIFVRLEQLCSLVIITHSPWKEQRAAGSVTQSANFASLMHFEKRVRENGDKTITAVMLDSKEAGEASKFDLELVTQVVKHCDGSAARQVRRVIYVEKAKGGRPAAGDDAKKKRAIELRNQGNSLRNIEKILKVSKTVVQRWFKEDE